MNTAEAEKRLKSYFLDHPMIDFATLFSDKYFTFMKNTHWLLKEDEHLIAWKLEQGVFQKQTALTKEMILFTCHRGLHYCYLPLFLKGNKVGVLIFGGLKASLSVSEEKIHQLFEEATLQIKKILREEKTAFTQITKLLKQKIAEFPSLAELSKELQLPESKIRREIKCHTEKTFSEYRTDLKIAYAVQKLVGTKESISLIATSIGYFERSSFNKAFKRRKGLSPSEYRQKYHHEKRKTEA